MDSEDEAALPHSHAKQYAVLRSDLSVALAAFDRAQDWADLIHDLQRVNRVLNKHSSSTYLPEKPLLAKRLSQCLTSFLPSGVHLKALETYHIVFKRIGPARLARDLPLYAAGLFPLFSHCATSIKAPLLSLYENHFLPLGVALCPVLDGFVLALLPGVEDESSEFYIRSRNLLDRLTDAVDDIAIFARSLWRALLLSPPMRLAAAHYLRLKLATDHDGMRAEMVSDMPLVAYAITAALSDDDALTQRSVLDLLLGELALDSPFFEIHSERERHAAVAIVAGVLGALLKRDMSLTKRVHAWFLGGKDSSEGIAFCTRYSNDLVLAAMDRECRAVLESSGGKIATAATRPCRIAAALLDRDELSRCIGHHFALRILQYGRTAVVTRENEHERDIRHAISDLLQDLGSGRVFAELERMLASEKVKTLEDFELLTFALSLFPSTDDVVRRKHLPALLRVAVQSLNAVSTDNLTLDKAVSFCTGAIQAMGRSEIVRIEEDLVANIKATVSSFASFFVAWLAHVVEPAPAELRRAYNDVTVAEEYASEIRMATVCESRKECISLAKGACSFFVTAVSLEIGGTETLSLSLQATAKCANAADVRISLAGARAFADISVKASYYVFNRRGEDDEQVFGVIRRCWRQMHPSLRTATPQSAQALLGLQHRFPEETKIIIADGILSTDLSRRLRNLERFACLWRLAVEHRLMPFPADNGLFLMLDALTDEDWAPKMLARSWLSDALEVDAASVIDAPLRLLLTLESRNVGPQHEFAATYDAPRALYGFQVLRGILESCSTIDGSKREQGYILRSPSQFARRDGKRGLTGVLAMAAAAVSARTNQAISAVFAITDNLVNDSNRTASGNHPDVEGPVVLSHLLPAPNYVIVVALTCLGYLRGRVPARFSSAMNSFLADPKTDPNNTSRHSLTSVDFADDEYALLCAGLGFKSFQELHAGVCAAAAECLATLFRAIHVPSQLSSFIANVFAEPVLTLIKNTVDSADPVLQLHFIDTAVFLVTADGPCYLSSVQGKEAFMKPETGRIRLSYSESQNQLPGVKPADQVLRGVQMGYVETQDHFVPWLLDGVSATCRNVHLEQDRGSHEVLGVRRRWIQFIETVIRHVGVTLPTVVEGLLLILSELLNNQRKKVVSDHCLADSEFSRVDETLVLLEGLTVVMSNVLWSFEFALANGDLNDNSQADSTSAGEVHRNQAVSFAQDLIPAGSKDDVSNTANEDGISNESISQNGHTGTVGQPVAAATAMINAINPLRMINDFVKDVLSGTGSDSAQRVFDPRRSGARILFCLLPSILKHLGQVWGPLAESSVIDIGFSGASLRMDDGSPLRLSTELPKERRQAQRASVIAVLEPVFELRQTDVVASVIALFAAEQENFGAMNEENIESSAKVACQILHALEEATPDVIVACTGWIFEKSARWDASRVDAKEGRSQLMLREKARDVISRITEIGTRNLDANEIKTIGQVAPGEVGSVLPGGTVGLDIGQGAAQVNNRSTPGHTDLFHWGDFFAVYAPGKVETACFNFLENYLSSRRDAEDVQASYSVLHSLLKDALANSKRRSTAVTVLKVLGTFVSRSPSPFPDRKHRRDIMNLAVSAINTCSNIASCSLDISSDELQGHGKDTYKRELSVLALRVLASTIPILVDSVFLDDKPQLSSTVSSCLVPAVAVLKKAASRSASNQGLSDKKLRALSREPSPKRQTDQHLDALASKAAIDVILNVSNRDWGVKHARRELLVLLDDPNFFFGKPEGVLEKTSKIVREVVASGGAATLLTSIGSSSSNGAPGIPGLFAGRDSETVLRARAIRRVAYCVFVSEPDFYSPQLPSVLERVRDALRMGEARLVVECLLCLRALLVRIGPSSISAFRATTLAEMFRIACNPIDDLSATVAALQFLDLTALLSPADYSYERCFFFGETDLPDVIPGSELKPFKPLAISLSLLWTGEDRSLEEVFKTPLRLEAGRTVLAGNAKISVDKEFVGRYASALMKRNAMPEMKATAVDMEATCIELEQEFAQ